MHQSYSRRRWLSQTSLFCGVAALSGVTLPSLEGQTSFADESGVRNAVAHSRNLQIPSRTIRFNPPSGTDKHPVVTAIATNPRGDLLAAAGDDHRIRIIEVATLRTIQTLDGHRDIIRTLSFDPLGTSLVSAGNDGQVIVWDCENAFKILQKMSGTPALACVRFAPDGSEIAAVGFDRTVFIIGRPSANTPKFACDCNDLRGVAYRDDMKLLATGGRDGKLHLFDPVNGERIAEPQIHKGRIRDIRFHRDANTVVTAGDDGYMVVFDTDTRKVRTRLKASTGSLFAVAVIDSQLVAVAGSDNTIRIVNTDDGKIRATLDGHVGSVSTLATAPGMLFSGGFDATLRRWNVDTLSGSKQRIAEGGSVIDR